MRAAACAAGLLAAGCGGGPRTETAPAAPTPAPASAPANVIEHTVRTGETLARIADNYYGDPDQDTRIARDNGLDASAAVAPGAVLRLRFDAAEWEAARRRATALDSYNSGVELMAQERLAEAQNRFETSLDIAPDLAAARYNLALVHLKRGHNDQALDLLADLTERRPRDPDFRFAYGNALFQATRFAEAVDQFRLVLAAEPDQRRAAFGLARSLQEAGRRDEAIAAWERYLALDADSGWARAARENLEKLRHDTGGR